jgi:hypothetical protein
MGSSCASVSVRDDAVPWGSERFENRRATWLSHSGPALMPPLCVHSEPYDPQGLLGLSSAADIGLRAGRCDDVLKMFSRCLRVARDSSRQAVVSRYRAISHSSVPVGGEPFFGCGWPNPDIPNSPAVSRRR